ncbi:Meprin A subunit beta [Armadillidium vulgare]|nr:Meprin A subunit beta [Armadillidium vulgare]
MSLPTHCNTPHTVLHELLHSIGFDHEHQRPDRDDYVTILHDNVKKGKERLFEKRKNMETFGISYDYESVMHYHRMTFSKNDKPTIITKNPKYQDKIGNALVLSEKDIMKVKKIKHNQCTSYVGRNGGPQLLKLGLWCTIRGIIHELHHAIGFLHEQNRPDRDEYLEIKWKNMNKKSESYMRKAQYPYNYTYGVPYDYLSISHYTPFAYSRNGNPHNIYTHIFNTIITLISEEDKSALQSCTICVKRLIDWAKFCFVVSCANWTTSKRNILKSEKNDQRMSQLGLDSKIIDVYPLLVNSDMSLLTPFHSN